MQFTRNRRILFVQDIILIFFIHIFCLCTLDSVQIGQWRVGGTFVFDTSSTEISEECVEDFYASYVNADGDELDEKLSFTPAGILKSAFRGGREIYAGVTNGTVEWEKLGAMPEWMFDDCADLLFMVHVVNYTSTNTVYQGWLYATLFVTTATMPMICIIQAAAALIRFFLEKEDFRKRHRRVVLCVRRTILPLFVVMALTVILPEVTLSSLWFCGIGVYLLCAIWNLVASHIKRNTRNEREFLTFVQIPSGIGAVLVVGALWALDQSHISVYMFDHIRYADGMEIIWDCFNGYFDVPKLLMLIFVAVFFVGIGMMIRYLYYALLRFACIMESTGYKKVEKEGMIVLSVFILLSLATSFFLFEASGRLKLELARFEMIAFFVAMGLMVLVLITEIVQRILCYINPLGREYRNDLLCGCTDDRMYSEESVETDSGDPV